jgi:predicted permease
VNAPRWARWLLIRLAPPEREEEVVGDLEEAHRQRVERLGRLLAMPLTALDTMDMAVALLRDRRERRVGASGRRSGLSGGGSVSWIDLKLGLRLLVKYPGMTVLGGVAIAFAIFVGAATFELLTQVFAPRIPLPDGDRIVDIRLWDASRGRIERNALFDAMTWREQLGTIEDVTVYRSRPRNLVTADGLGEPVQVAEMGAVGFRLARTPPLMGRVLLAADDPPGVQPVVVLGHDLWRRRFGADPEIVGREIRLDDIPTTVIGIMPEGFGFPLAHEVWMAPGPDQVAYEPSSGPPVVVLGRLAQGATLESAQAELAAYGRQMAEAYPATHEHLQPRVVPLGRSILILPSSITDALVTIIGLTSNAPLILFLILVCGNIGLLMFARAVSRERELVVRSALGASRRRIVSQLFAESLVLAGLAALAGVAAAGHGLRWALAVVQEEFAEGEPLPFWIGARISPETILYAGLLAVLAALVAGAWPGLRVTRSLGEGLKQSRDGFRFGGIWTVVIASQIVVTMLFPVVTLLVREEGQVELDYEPPFVLEEFAVARVQPGGGPDPENGEPEGSTPVALRLAERLGSEPGVAGVTMAERLPMTYHPWNQIEIAGPATPEPDERGHRVGSARVTIDFFEVMGGAILQGRGFRPSDLEEGALVVVVDQGFVDRVLGGRNPVGVQLRYRANEDNRDPTQEPGPWLEIVGVVEEIGARCFYGPGGIYHPVGPSELAEPFLIARRPGGAEGLPPRIRALGVQIDPTLRLDDVETLVEATSGPRTFYAFWTTILVAVSGLALLLSLGGIYAVMSYTVSQRTREIGIRTALGSTRSRTVAAVLRRPLIQVGLGVGAGAGFLLLALPAVHSGDGLRLLAGISGYSLGMALICLIACAVPIRRALRIQPGEALRVDG